MARTPTPPPTPHVPDRRRPPYHPSEWDLNEPASFTRIARSPVELAVLTGIVMRLFRAIVLTHGSPTSNVYLGASFLVGTIFLLGMATLHLGRFPVRDWPWRAGLFAVFETVGEMATSLMLIALHREPWGTVRAEFHDWQPMARGVFFWRLVSVFTFALLLGAVVQVVRARMLRKPEDEGGGLLPEGQPFIERRKRSEFDSRGR